MTEHGSSGDEILYYGPLIEFDSNDPDFVRGIEIGHLMGKLDVSQNKVEQIMRRSNEEMLHRVAHAYGREYTIQFLDEVWMAVRLEPPTMPNVMDAMKA